MIEIGELNVNSYILDELTITWQVEIDPEEDILDYEMFVLRSQAPEDDFEEVSPGLFDVYSYVDLDAGTRSKWRKYYYKVKAVHTPSGREFYSEAEQSYIPTEMTLLGLEVARRNRLLLDEFVGVDCYLYIMRRFGPRCPTCWDFNKRQVTKSSCEDCYKVGRYKGYFAPMQVKCQFNPHAQSVDHANIGEMEPGETNAWTTNYPLISPGDLIIEPGNKRWRVSAISTTEQHRVPVRQMLQLHLIDKSDVEYRIEVPNA